MLVTVLFMFLSGLILIERQVPPTFVTKPNPQRVCVGKRAMFECVVSGSAPLNVVWLKDRQAVSGVPTHCETLRGGHKIALDICAAKPSDRGLYTCRVSNNVGAAERSVRLRVIEKPNSVKPPSRVAAVVGAPLHLQRQLDEATGVSASWTRDGRGVHQCPDCKPSFEDKTVALEILKTTLEDCGSYVCTVAKEAGGATCAATVKVQGKTFFSSPLKAFSLLPVCFSKRLL